MITRFALEPTLGLSPSSPAEPTVQCNPSQTTPKLPRRERVASFSRLLNPDKFLELFPSQSRGAANKEKQTNGRRNLVDNLPSIRISPSSPPQSTHRDDVSLLQDIEKGCIDSHQLPFSPHLLNVSPKYLSPHYIQPTPTKSPLYATSCHSSLFLGRGSFGNVSLCSYKGSKFALKIAHRPACVIGEYNFLNIRHPHLVRILHIGQVLDKALIFMEFAGHCNLQQVLDTKSELDFPRRLSFCTQVLSGLRHCHKHGVVHADIKPANVIVSPYGICKLGDFGLSFRGTSSQAAIGTVAYAAPEVLRGSCPTTQSDIFSYGVLLWQVHSRKLPFVGEHPHVIIYKVALYEARPLFDSIEDVFVEKYSKIAELCWHRAPEMRPSASEALFMLQGIARDVKLLKMR